MNAKQIVVGALVTCLFILPKEFLFKPDNFWLNMLLNIVGFSIGGLASVFFVKNKISKKSFQDKMNSNGSPKITLVEKPLPEPTKIEDYKNFMPK